MIHIAYIGIGSNLEDPELQINSALKALQSFSELMSISPLYASQAIGPGEQPDYLNAVVKLSTALEPLALLQQLQLIENNHGRVRTIRWGARTLDLDLLLFDDHTLESEELTIPHPRMTERNFVIYPLFDIEPGLKLPNGENLATIKQKLNETGLEKLR